MATSSLHLERVRYIQQSLRQVQLRWSVSKQNGDVGGRLTVQLLIIDHSGQREWICQRVGPENVEEDFYDVPSHLLNAGHTYEFNVKLMSHENNSADEDDDSALMQVLSTKTLKFRLGYTMNEMKELEAKANGFITERGRHRRPCQLFYRDRDEEYYDQCRLIGFLPPTLKNENGDPASPINGCIYGIFLGVSTDWKTDDLPASSPYGYLRFHIPIERLYGPDFNLYFADFYCHVGSKSHHLTLVLTKADSHADTFCKCCLPKLNKMANSFLYQDWKNHGRMMHTTTAWIHVFYTEWIPINGGWFDKVHWSAPNIDTNMGKPKNASCEICNI